MVVAAARLRLVSVGVVAAAVPPWCHWSFEGRVARTLSMLQGVGTGAGVAAVWT